jgi:phenylacetate-CoA ligase
MHRWVIWNVLFRLQERVKGHPTFDILREMQAADRLSAADLERLQRTRLQEFIGYCHRYVPYVRTFMREAGIQPADIRTPGDLVRLPLMTKAVVRDHRVALRSEIAGKLVPFATGGSTGEPLIFDLAKRRIASRVACRQRVDLWWGLSVGDPEIAVWGSPIEVTHQDRLRGLRDWLLATRLLPAFEMNEATISRYLDILETRPCRQIFGYPSALHLLCLHAQKQGRNLRRLSIRAAFVTGEVLYPHQRELIVETLNCPVANGYGGRDSGCIAHECPQGGMHVLADATIVELLDPQGRPVAPGEPGEVVVTDLYSHEAPFLRYRTGDVAAWSTRRCACGRALPLFENIAGRSNDSVLAPDGRIINSLALIYPVREVEGIERFRIAQKALDCFHVQVVRTSQFQSDAEARIRSGWVRLLRTPLQVTFEYVTELPMERSGKFRHFVSEIPAAHSGEQLRDSQAAMGISSRN